MVNSDDDTPNGPQRGSSDATFTTKPMPNGDSKRTASAGAPVDVDAVAGDSAALRAALADSGAFPVALPAALATHARYRIIRQLGAGGMGVVYQAEHRLMERSVALKVISRALVDDAQAVERFRVEVKAAARLSHPNIVTAFDAEQAGDLHFLVMEFVDGLSLARQVEMRGPLPLQYACGFVRQVALGLQHAYEKGMVHRDIKPQNLMVTRAGRVKILDFGLARLAREKSEPAGNRTAPPAMAGAAIDPEATRAFLVDQAASLRASLPGERASDGGLTAAGSTIGTPDYIAPEQITNSRAADIRSDIYSLGGTFYFLLTGVPPFPGGSIVDKLVAHHQTPPRDVREFRPDLPSEVAAIVQRMLAKDPRDRFQIPAEVAQALLPFSRSPTAGATTLVAESRQPADDSVEKNSAAKPAVGKRGSVKQNSVTGASVTGAAAGATVTPVAETARRTKANALPTMAPPIAGPPIAGPPIAGLPIAGLPVWDAAVGFDFNELAEPPPDFGPLASALPPSAPVIGDFNRGTASGNRSRPATQRFRAWVSQPFDNRTLIWLAAIGGFAVLSLVVLIAISTWSNKKRSNKAQSNIARSDIAQSDSTQSNIAQSNIAQSDSVSPPQATSPIEGDSNSFAGPPVNDRRALFPGFRPPLGKRPPRPIQLLLVVPHQNLYYPDFRNVMRALEKKSLASRVTVASSVARPAIPEPGFREERSAIPVAVALADAVPHDYDAVIFTGSNPLGSMEFLARGTEFQVTERFVRSMLREGRCVAGICGGIAVLADAGAVRGQIVAHNPYAMDVVQPGHGIVDWDRSRRVVVDTETHVVTASDPADAMKFVETVLGQVAQRRTNR
jgi:serine/threonine protein kinase/putative intracellular protease/amidase